MSNNHKTPIVVLSGEFNVTTDVALFCKQIILPYGTTEIDTNKLKKYWRKYFNAGKRRQK